MPTAKNERVGIVGVGRMGLSMLKHLIKHGHQVTACDLDETQLAKAREAGAATVKTPAEVARALNYSPRTLGRRLEQAGTTFTALLDETRRALSEQYLRRTDFSVAEVAYLVGFAEASSFNRAFRRWTGRAPGDLRRREATADPAAA